MWKMATEVAEFLRNHPKVEWVNYAGFPDSPYHALAQKYLSGHACSLMTVGINGGFPAQSNSMMHSSWSLRLVNLGDAKSWPATPRRPPTAKCQPKSKAEPELRRR